MSEKSRITRLVSMPADAPDAAALREAGAILKNGGLVAFPTETVYGLGGNALDADAARRIYAAKGRPSDNPLIIHIAETDALEAVAESVPESARALAEAFWPGPMTLIVPRGSAVPHATTGGLETVAVRMPSHPVASELIREAGGFVAAPSANASGRPSPTTAQHVLEDLDGRIDMIIDAGPVQIGLESTIIDCTTNPPMILRPGYISREMIGKVTGGVGVDPGIIAETADVRPKAPGMKYRHYAPKAEMNIVEGSAGPVAEMIRRLAREKMNAGCKVGILCSEESADAYPEGVVRSVGAARDEETIARHLYDTLRAFDADGVDFIYSEAFHTPRIGPAIMNRLQKAAGYRVIEACGGGGVEND